MTIGRRLKEERERLGLTQPAFAALGGVLKGAQIAYESDKSSPTAAHLAAAAAEGVDVLYVVTGRREAQPRQVQEAPTPGSRIPPVSLDTTQASTPPVGGAVAVPGSCLLAPADVSLDRPMTLPVRFAAGARIREYQVIPRFQTAAAAGRLGARTVDGEAMQADVAGVLAIECEYMRRALGRDGPGFVTVTVAGDSMEPTLGDGDVIIVDTAQTAIDASGIYVVELAGDLLVKRVQRRMDGSLVLKSDNPAYDPEHIQAAAVQSLRVVGRMTRLRFR